MVPAVLKVLVGLELLQEMGELHLLGLSEDEIEGYVEFYSDNYPELKDDISSKSLLSSDGRMGRTSNLV